MPWLLVGVLLGHAILSPCAASLGERAFPPLSSSTLADLANMRDASKNLDASDPYSHLQKILIPRPGTYTARYLCLFCTHLIGVSADTENNTLVRNYIISTLRNLNWHIEEDNFVAATPYGPKNFTNVIATKDPDAPRRVVLAAHFDSKFFPSYPENQACPSTSRRSLLTPTFPLPPLFLSLIV
jgi:glutaminyl-peptide cyclotransferase